MNYARANEIVGIRIDPVQQLHSKSLQFCTDLGQVHRLLRFEYLLRALLIRPENAKKMFVHTDRTRISACAEYYIFLYFFSFFLFVSLPSEVLPPCEERLSVHLRRFEEFVYR